MIRLLMLLLCAIGLLLGGCGADSAQDAKALPAAQKKLLLYSELDSQFTEHLLEAFNEEYRGKLQLSAIYELKADGPKPDMVLAEQRTLNGLRLDQRLKPVAFAAGDRLPREFRDDDLMWYGVFYDPTVFLVNQEFARKVGQSNIRSWNDLESLPDIRIALENLTDSNSTKNFLGGLADHFGETESLNYLWNINHHIDKYAKFPFTPIRITAVGDADLAITRRSYVFKYLEIRFPAYVVYPQEGAPANLYGLGIFRSCTDDVEALDFMEWMLSSDKVRAVALEDATGYLFLLPRGINGQAANTEKIWLNKSYLTLAGQEALTAKWLERVRFSK